MKILDRLPIMAEARYPSRSTMRAGPGKVVRPFPRKSPTMSSPSPVNRRDFSKAALAGQPSACACGGPRRATLPRDDRVRIGCLGVGYRGVQVLNAFVTPE